jgi:hypothetical protein
MAKGNRDNLLYGNKKVTPTTVQDMDKQREILRKLAEAKIKMNK